MAEQKARSAARRAALARGEIPLTKAFWGTLADNVGPAAVLIVVAAALGIVFGHHLNWGDVPTWVLALTTLLAFVAAAFAGVVAYDLLQIERARDATAALEAQDRQEAERRAQASRVAAWYSTWEEQEPFTQVRRLGRHWGAVIRNASDLPVYGLRVLFCVPVPHGSGLTWRQGERFLSPPRAIVPPGECTVELPDDIRQDVEADGHEPEWLVAFEFADAAGGRWLRDPQGRLSSAGVPQQPE